MVRSRDLQSLARSPPVSGFVLTGTGGGNDCRVASKRTSAGLKKDFRSGQEDSWRWIGLGEFSASALVAVRLLSGRDAIVGKRGCLSDWGGRCPVHVRLASRMTCMSVRRDGVSLPNRGGLINCRGSSVSCTPYWGKIHTDGVDKRKNGAEFVDVR